MKRLLIILILNALALLCAHGISAKQIKVRIQAENGAANEVAKSIAARLQGTERYAVTEGDAELYLHLSCVEGKEVSSVNGYICSFVFSYYPEKLAPLVSLLGPYGLVTGRDVSSVAEAVFTSFVAATTIEKLERAQKDLRIAVLGYCHSTIFDKDVRADCGQSTDK
jgi:hypothetical protein